MFRKRYSSKARRYRPKLQVLETRNLLSTCVVNHLADDSVGSGLYGSLRYCIANAVDGDVIRFAVTGTINLDTYPGELDLAHNIRIEGPGANLLTVRRDFDNLGPYFRIFTVLPAATVNISGLTVANGYSTSFGGGIANFGTLTLDNTAVVGNTADECPTGKCGFPPPASGGGIGNNGTLTINDSTISGNHAVRDGGGIANGDSFTWEGGSVTLNNSTVAGNRASAGGGIYKTSGAATLTISNSTIARNEALIGGGGGIRGQATLRNTIRALNSDDPTTGHIDGSYNLIGGDPLLGSLQDNGGPTQTMALLTASPALNAGDPAQLGVPDQRGVVRSGGVNIGAYQASASAFVLTAPATVTAGTPFDVTVKAVDIFGQTALGYTGTATFSTTDPDPGVVLPPDYTFTASDQGTHTFSGGFTLMTPGDEMLTATDSASGFSASTLVTVQGAGPAPGRHRGTDSMDAVFSVLAAESSRRESPNSALAFWDGLITVS